MEVPGKIFGDDAGFLDDDKSVISGVDNSEFSDSYMNKDDDDDEEEDAVSEDSYDGP